ncbi:MAG: radical SAM protein [Polyangiaceae bacterium]|nr:radical SAM protein [Polyangiaceae bacterium]
MPSKLDRIGALSVTDHDRGVTEMRYVYPVVSRRAGGVSIGVNLNPNNACNWRCVYCQVPDLKFGKGPPVDLELLERELGETLDAVVHGDLLERAAPEGARRLNDIALSGNGEPTTSPDFGAALEVIARAMDARSLLGSVKLVLITNGSMMARPEVQIHVRRMAELGGEVWFKLDSATGPGALAINNCHAGPEEHFEKLRAAALACPTWLQTCWFRWRGAPPSEQEQAAYLAMVERLKREAVPVRGVHLYTLARPSLQPEAPELEPLDAEWLTAFARRIEALGLPVKVSV